MLTPPTDPAYKPAIDAAADAVPHRTLPRKRRAPSPDLGRKEGLFPVGAVAFEQHSLFDKLDGKRSVDGVVPAGCLSGWPTEEDNGIHVLNEFSGWRQRRSGARELTGAGGNAGSLVRLCQFSEILSEI